MRAVLFQFYTIETVLNLVLMFLQIRGFLSQPLEALSLQRQVAHYFFCGCFYAFTVLILFASINNCTAHPLSLCEEIVRSVVGFLLYVSISLKTLQVADSNILHAYVNDALGVEKPVHPLFTYMHFQAVCALANGVTYLLHATIVVDVLLSNERGARNPNENSDEYEVGDYVPVRVYFLSEWVQTKLEQYEWFQAFTHSTFFHI